jgi:hypothetical protein
MNMHGWSSDIFPGTSILEGQAWNVERSAEERSVALLECDGVTGVQSCSGDYRERRVERKVQRWCTEQSCYQSVQSVQRAPD